MWVMKGSLLGITIFIIGSILFLYTKLRPIEVNKATSVNLLLSLTVRNTGYWVAFVLTIALALIVTHYYSKA